MNACTASITEAVDDATDGLALVPASILEVHKTYASCITASNIRVIESLGVDGRWWLDVAHMHGTNAAARVPNP